MKHHFRIQLCAYFLIGLSPVFSQGFDPSSVRSTECKPGTYNCGYLPAPKEIQDSIPLKRDFNSFEELPSKVDLSSKMPPVGSQGQQSSCVAWATGYAIKSYLASEAGRVSSFDPPFKGGQGKNVFSPAFIYNQQNGGKDNGLYYYKTLEFLQKSGVAPWNSMPYTDKDYKKQPSESAKQEALAYRIKSFSRLNFKNPDEVKRVLASGNVVLVGIIIDDGFYKVKGSSVYDQNEGQSYGGHAMTIVGYDDSKVSSSGKNGAFKLQNSWGENWGDKGFGWVSYSMLAKVGQETYALIDDPKTNTQPTVAPPTANKTLSPPLDIKASRGEFSNKIVLTWAASDGALSYLVQRKEDTDKYNELGYSNVPTITDTNVSANTTYTYRILSISSDESSKPSKDIEGFTSAQAVSSGKLEKVIGLDGKAYLESTSAKVSLSWSEIDGASEYLVAKADSSKKWKNIGKVSDPSFIDPSPSKEQTNVYRVCAAIKGKKAGDWSDSLGIDVADAEATPSQVSDLKASEGDFPDKIQLSWNPAPGATIYYLYRFNDDGDPTGSFETNATTYDDKDEKVLKGEVAAYTVIAANDTGYSEPSEFAFGNVDPALAKRAAGVTLPPPGKLTSEINVKDKKIKLKWKPVKDSSEYYIYRKQLATGSKSKNTKFEFVSNVAGNLTSFTENMPGNPGDLFMYTVRSKSEFGAESKDSNIISVFINKEPSPIKKRALSIEEIPKTFLGTWSGFYWHPKLGPQKLLLEIGGSNQDFTATLKINEKVTKQFAGSWTPGSTGLKTDVFQFDLSREMVGSSIVRLSSVAELAEDTEFSFAKD